MSCSPPPLKQTKIPCQVDNLADNDLEEIFKRLPPHDRLVVSEVSRRWHEISRKPWLDIKSLDLIPIPGKHVRAVINRCPNLQLVSAVEKSFDSNELISLDSLSSLTSVKLFGCHFTMDYYSRGMDIFQNIFHGSVERARWIEFILHEPVLEMHAAYDECAFIFSATSLPASLKRLQLSGIVRITKASGHEEDQFLAGLERLANLECFILQSTSVVAGNFVDNDMLYELADDAVEHEELGVFDRIGFLKNLKELSIGPLGDNVKLESLISSLPKLQVLFLSDIADGDAIAEGFKKLITMNALLQILVLSGPFHTKEPIQVPARKRFPTGFGGSPLPFLHVFVGREASQNIRLAETASDAAIIHLINLPMPEFLEREDIAPIFEGVWIAEKIKETAQNGGVLSDY